MGSQASAVARARSAHADGFYGTRGKRLLDALTAFVLLVVVSPVLLLVGTAVLLTSGWPVFYVDRGRLGRSGEFFGLVKFRTMVRNAPMLLAHLSAHPSYAPEFLDRYKLTDDPRCTSFGKWLRKTSLDELPQLINVVRGEMSLVGPRPITERELTLHYSGSEEKLLSRRPGLTGSWQVNGRSRLSYDDRVALDLEYVERISFRRDIEILFKTVPAVLAADGAL